MAKKFVEPEYDVYKVDEVELVLERDFYIVGNNKITNSSSAAEIFRQFWNENLINIQEQFSVMLLSQSNKVIGMYQHSKGAINSTVADIELIAAVAVKSLAKGVIVAHNHPSGALTPSEADIKLTKRLKEALALFQINLLDSLIIVQDKTTYYSLSDSGDFADGGVIIGDNSVKEEYIIKDGSDRYYSRGMSSGNVKWNDSQDMAYMFNKHQAESIKKKLELEGYSNLSVEKYDKDWWKKMENGGEIVGLTADEAIYLYVKKALVQKAREKYLKPAGLWNTPKAKDVEKSLIKKGFLNNAGAITEVGKNKAREVDASVDRFISKEYISSQNVVAEYKKMLEKFEGNKMARGGATKDKKYLYKTKIRGAFGEYYIVVNAYDESDALYHTQHWAYTENEKLIGKPIKTTKKFVDGLRMVENQYWRVFSDGGMMAMGGQLDVGKYYKTKSGKQVRYLGKTKDPEVGTFTNKADGVSKIRYDEIEGKASLFAKGGYMEKGGKIKEDDYFVYPNGRGIKRFRIKNIKGDKVTTEYSTIGSIVQNIESKEDLLESLELGYIKKVTEKEYWDKKYDNKMAMGGKTFEGKVKSIKKSLLERKKVPKSVQKDYGKTFSPKEAEDSAKRIVGSLTARERMKSKIKK